MSDDTDPDQQPPGDDKDRGWHFGGDPWRASDLLTCLDCFTFICLAVVAAVAAVSAILLK